MDILVVEDEPQIAKNLAELLATEGHETRVAHTVAQARDLIVARKPAVVFLDVHLPDGSGLDLLDANAGIAFIIITGTPAEETLDTAFAGGAVAYLVKPFSLVDVLDAIAQVG